MQDVCNILLRTRIAIMLCPYRHDSLRLLIVFKLKLSTRQFIQITGSQRVPSLTIINGVIFNGLQSPNNINVVSTHFLPWLTSYVKKCIIMYKIELNVFLKVNIRILLDSVKWCMKKWSLKNWSNMEPENYKNICNGSGRPPWQHTKKCSERLTDGEELKNR